MLLIRELSKQIAINRENLNLFTEKFSRLNSIMNFNCAPNFPSFDFIMHEKIGAQKRFCLEGENEPPIFTLIFFPF